MRDDAVVGMKNGALENETYRHNASRSSHHTKEEQACLQLWFKDKSTNEDVRRGIEKSLTKISEALGKLAAFEKIIDHGKTDNPPNM